jgi:SagB-type dehydrogenase family enzyme
MELYLAAGKVKGIEAGLYHYLLDRHALRLVKRVDLRQSIAGAAWGQACIQTAPAVLVLGATYGRTTGVYGDRGVRYVDMEAGHVGQNVHLQCEALGLGTVMIGAFQDARVKKLLGMKEEPLYIMPVGKKKE